MLQIITVFSGLTAFCLLYLIFCLFFKQDDSIAQRLGNIAKSSMKSEIDDELKEPIFKRVIKPILENISKTLSKIAPKEIMLNTEKKVLAAGKPFNMEAKDWINMVMILMIVLPIVSLILCRLREVDLKNTLLIVIIEIGGSYIIPNFILGSKVTERSKEIQNTLPDMLDLLTVSVEAGLGFDSALAKVINKYPGVLANEFGRVLQEIKMGKSKKDALHSMVERTNVHDLTLFTGAIIQAEQFGVSIGNVLRIQSEQMRQKRKQRAQEKAAKAPIMMLIPMVMFIFPTIFSVLLGPAVIKLIKVFANM